MLQQNIVLLGVISLTWVFVGYSLTGAVAGLAAVTPAAGYVSTMSSRWWSSSRSRSWPPG